MKVISFPFLSSSNISFTNTQSNPFTVFSEDRCKMIDLELKFLRNFYTKLTDWTLFPLSKPIWLSSERVIVGIWTRSQGDETLGYEVYRCVKPYGRTFTRFRERTRNLIGPCRHKRTVVWISGLEPVTVTGSDLRSSNCKGTKVSSLTLDDSDHQERSTPWYSGVVLNTLDVRGKRGEGL